MDLSWRQEKMSRIIRIILFISSVISAYDVRRVFLPGLGLTKLAGAISVGACGGADRGCPLTLSPQRKSRAAARPRPMSPRNMSTGLASAGNIAVRAQFEKRIAVASSVTLTFLFVMYSS